MKKQAPEPRTTGLEQAATWLEHADARLTEAKDHKEGRPYRFRCEDALYAAEHALTGVIVAMEEDYPITHDIRTLLSAIEETGIKTPEKLNQAAMLSRFAGRGRYDFIREGPPQIADVNKKTYEASVNNAETVVEWSRETIRQITEREGHSQWVVQGEGEPAGGPTGTQGHKRDDTKHKR